MYGWINFRIAEYCLEASDFLNYDLPKKLIEKIIRCAEKAKKSTKKDEKSSEKDENSVEKGEE